MIESEREKLLRLLSAGLISEAEFMRAQHLIDVAEQSDAPAIEAEVLPAPPLRSMSLLLVGSAAVIGILAAAILVVVSGSSDEEVLTAPGPERPSIAELMLGDHGIGPFAWGSTQAQVLGWLRQQLGPEQLLADVTHAACPSGVTGFATWTSGYSFRAAFDENGLRGYHLFPDMLAPSAMGWGNFVGQFVGPSEIRISTSLEDIMSRHPETALREVPATLGDPSTLAAVIGGQGFGLTGPGDEGPFLPDHVRSMFAGIHSCYDTGLASADGDASGVELEPAPVRPGAITLRSDGLGDVPFGTHPDTVLAWLEERLGPPIDRWVGRDLGCPTAMIGNAQWEGLVVYFFKGQADDGLGLTGRGFAPTDTFDGYWHNPVSLASDTSTVGVLKTAEGIGPGVPLRAVLDAYPDAWVFDAVMAGQDGSPYGDRPPSFRTPSGLSGELTGTAADSLVISVSGGTDFCGE